MKIEKSEYENLVRDSEKLRIIETIASENNLISGKEILVICGYATGENQDV